MVDLPHNQRNSTLEMAILAFCQFNDKRVITLLRKTDQKHKEQNKSAPPTREEALMYVLQSTFLNSTGRTSASAGSAANAGVGVDYILAVAFRDSAYRTFASTGSAANTRIINYICHNKFLLNGNRFESIL